MARILIFYSRTVDEDILLDITVLAFRQEFMLLVVRSVLETACYLDAMYALRDSTPQAIQGKIPSSEDARKIAFLTCIPYITHTDALKLMERFGTIRNISAAEKHELRDTPGVGEKKANYIYSFFRTKIQK